MQDPAYASLYHETEDLLAKAEAATERALTKALERQRQADEALQDLRDHAARPADGRRVYRAEDGRFRTEDGSAVSESDASGAHWHPGMPSYKDFLERRDAAKGAADDVGGLRRYQVDVLGSARDKLNDPDHPPDMDGLNDLNKSIRDGMPAYVQQEMPTQETQATATVSNALKRRMRPDRSRSSSRHWKNKSIRCSTGLSSRPRPP